MAFSLFRKVVLHSESLTAQPSLVSVSFDAISTPVAAPGVSLMASYNRAIPQNNHVSDLVVQEGGRVEAGLRCEKRYASR